MAKTKRYRAAKTPDRKINVRSDETTIHPLRIWVHQNVHPEATRPGYAESKTGQTVTRDLSFIGREILWIMITTGIVIYTPGNSVSLISLGWTNGFYQDKAGGTT